MKNVALVLGITMLVAAGVVVQQQYPGMWDFGRLQGDVMPDGTVVTREFKLTVGNNTSVRDSDGKKITGLGYIDSNVGIGCSETSTNVIGACEQAVGAGSNVTLTAIPYPHRLLSSWDTSTSSSVSCPCAGSTDLTCSFVMDQDVNCNAWYIDRWRTSVKVKGDSGNQAVVEETIEGTDPKTCNADPGCVDLVEKRKTVHINVTPNPGYVFTSWFDWIYKCPCDDASASCSFVVEDDEIYCAPIISAEAFLFKVATNPDYKAEMEGTVDGDSSFFCLSYSCGKNISKGQSVSFTAKPKPGYTFSSWEDLDGISACPCKGSTSPTCAFTFTAKQAGGCMAQLSAAGTSSSSGAQGGMTSSR